MHSNQTQAIFFCEQESFALLPLFYNFKYCKIVQSHQRVKLTQTDDLERRLTSPPFLPSAETHSFVNVFPTVPVSVFSSAQFNDYSCIILRSTRRASGIFLLGFKRIIFLVFFLLFVSRCSLETHY